MTAGKPFTLVIIRDLTVVLGCILPRGDGLEDKAKELLIARSKKDDFLLLRSNRSFLHESKIKEGLLSADKLHLTQRGAQVFRSCILNYIDTLKKKISK